VELVAGYLAAWAVRKARRAAGRADAQVDRALDAGLDRLHDMVSQRLSGDAALARLETEAAERGEVGGRTRQRVALAVEEAAERDPAFAAQLADLVAGLPTSSVNIRASGHGVAAGVINGQVWTAAPPPPPASPPGNPSGPGPAAPRRDPATDWR
jgi:hypothetical protein